MINAALFAADVYVLPAVLIIMADCKVTCLCALVTRVSPDPDMKHSSCQMACMRWAAFLKETWAAPIGLFREPNCNYLELISAGNYRWPINLSSFTFPLSALLSLNKQSDLTGTKEKKEFPREILTTTAFSPLSPGGSVGSLSFAFLFTKLRKIVQAELFWGLFSEQSLFL